MYFCSSRKIIMVGMIAIMMPALMTSHWEPKGPLNLKRAVEMTCKSVLGMYRNGV
ncbi:hypothetical protein D1872_265880 [compost metagenome]